MAKKTSLAPKRSGWSDARKVTASERMTARSEELHAAHRAKSEERRAARDAFPEFAKTSLTIRPKSGELMLLSLNKVQEALHTQVERQRERTKRVRMLVLKARQPGISTYVEGRLFWRTVTGKGLRAFILTHEEPASDTLFAMAKRFDAHYDAKRRPEVTASNARELKFGATECSYRVGTAGTEGIGRSETIQLFHGSEVAYWPNADSHMAGVLQAVPDAEGTEVWLESTANGPTGLFHSMCLRAQAGIGPYELFFVPWFAHGEYTKTPPYAWEPEPDWRAYGEAHEVSRSKLYWAWSKNAELAGAKGEPVDKPCWLFRQEYPATVEDAFRTSGGKSYIAADLVEEAMLTRLPDEAGAPLIFGVDIARGGADRTHIIDRKGRRLGHRVNLTLDEDNEMMIAGQLVRLMQQHRPDMVFVDISGGYGGGVVDRLRELGHANVRGINFGWGSADKAVYGNKRAEMWAKLRAWLQEGADVVDDQELRRHLAAPIDRLDSQGRLMLEKKDDIRARLGLSPDRADAAALTFAEPVRRASPGYAPASTESAYEVLRF